MKKQLGKSNSIPVFYAGQNASGTPNHYEHVDEAKRLCQTGKARWINRNSAILVSGPRKTLSSTRNSTKRGWKVVNQTAKKNPLRPGVPRYASV